METMKTYGESGLYERLATDEWIREAFKWGLGKRGRQSPSESERHFRALTLLSHMSQHSASVLGSVEETWGVSGWLNYWLNGDHGDILSQMSALEVLPVLGASVEGFNLMKERHLFAGFEAWLKDGLMVGEALGVVSELAQQPHFALPVSPAPLLEAISENLEPSASCLGVAMAATAIFLTSCHRLAFLQHPELLSKYAFWCSPSHEPASLELFFNSLAVYLRQQGATRELFDTLADQAAQTPLLAIMTVLQRRGREPLRLAALEVLKSLVSSAWGAEMLVEFPGFFDFIIDRDTETSHDGLHAKYAILATLSRSHQELIQDFFDAAELARIQAYLVDGPVYAPPTPATVLVAQDTQ